MPMSPHYMGRWRTLVWRITTAVSRWSIVLCGYRVRVIIERKDTNHEHWTI